MYNALSSKNSKATNISQRLFVDKKTNPAVRLTKPAIVEGPTTVAGLV